MQYFRNSVDREPLQDRNLVLSSMAASQAPSTQVLNMYLLNAWVE